MKTPLKIAILAALAVVVVGAVALKNSKASKAPGDAASVAAVDSPKAPPVAATKLPKLLDLGADKCIPCKMMAPILEGLKKDYAGKFDVEFIDVWKNPAAGEQYKIEMIPTQIFYDAQGKEQFRHTGFFGKEDILGKWKELGVDIAPANANPHAAASQP